MTSARLLAAALATSILVACGSGDGGGKASAPAAGARRYTVRAQVVELPDAKAPKRSLEIRHEAIDDFEDASRRVVGMDSMVMPFALAPEVSLEGVRVGDAVEVVIAVGWEPPSLRIERLRELPEGTALRFRKARPAGAAGR
jgi:Cu/Ag efflux protein CusF